MKIFCTVGSQLPFDRLISIASKFANNDSRVQAFFQIGKGANFRPANQPYREVLTQSEFNQRVDECDLIVSHAGMGTILTGLTLGKPMLVLPRREQFKEHRNDHQVFGAEKLREMGLVNVANDEEELMDRLQQADSIIALPQIGQSASKELVLSIQSFISDVSPKTYINRSPHKSPLCKKGSTN